MLEMHYDNPEMRSDFVDSSGFRMYWTDEPQAIEIGQGGVALHAFGDGLGQWIPGGLSFVRNTGFMPSECTDDPSQEMWDASSISMHTNFGSQSINFESGVPDFVELPDDVQHLDFTIDALAVPDAETTYWCKLMKIPESNSTRYMLRFSALIEEGHEALVHHILGYVCDPDDDCESQRRLRQMPAGGVATYCPH